MTLRRIGLRYYIDIRIRGEKKRIRRALNTADKPEALELYKAEKDRILAEHHQRDIRFADFAEKYVEWARTSKPASAEQERRRIEKIKLFLASLGIEYLSSITPYHVEQLKARLLADGLAKDPKCPDPVGKTTVNRYLQLLRGMFYRAIDWELYKGQNPVRKVRFFRERQEIKPLSHDQVKQILDATREIAKEKRASPLRKIFPDLVEFAINTGLRKSEILNLRWKDVRAGEAHVVGKGDRPRTVPLNAGARAVLARQLRAGDPHVFAVPNRGQQDLMRRTFDRVRKKTGIDFHIHLLRHYFATTLIEKGVDLITVSEILGHSSLTTSLLYSHTDQEKKRKAVERLGAEFGPTT